MSPSSVWRKRTARGGAPGRLADESLDLGRIVVRLAAGCRLGERLEMALDVDDLGHPVDDRPLDLLGDRVRLVERQLARQLEVERDVEAVGQLDHRQVVDLADARDRHRRLAHPLAQCRLDTGGLDVDDDVAAGERSVHGLLDAVGDGMALTHGGARGDADHDVGERAAGRLAQPEPAHLDRRIERRDRGPRCANGIRRRPVHEHVDVAPDQARRRR